MLASGQAGETSAPAQLLPARQFTIEQLTAAYNQTRVDYLVPMPMNAARLHDYILTYSVDLDASLVALDGDQMLGLAMLGLRPGRSWVTRLGVLPNARRRGIGYELVAALLQASDQRGIPLNILEVIKNNAPAYNLFIRCGFQPVHELLVLRRPPGPPAERPLGQARWLAEAEALALLTQRADSASWIMATESLARVEQLQALTVTLPAGGQGWLVFQEQLFRGRPMQLTRLVLHTQAGAAAEVGQALLAHLYDRFPDLDTQAENIGVDDPHLPAYRALGFVEAFQRIEMHRQARLDH